MNANNKIEKSKGGCVSPIILLIGVLTIIFAIIGYILHFFDMVIKVYSTKMPMIDTPMFLILTTIGIVFLALSWGIGKIEDMIAKKKK